MSVKILPRPLPLMALRAPSGKYDIGLAPWAIVWYAIPSNALRGVASMAFSSTGSMLAGIAGSLAMAFSETNTLSGSGALAGAAAMTFTATALSGGTGVAAGNAQMAFTQTSAIFGIGTLMGVAALTFIESAAPTLPPGGTSGTTSMSMAATGTLSSSGSLSGMASNTLQSTGLLVGAGLLSGTASMTMDNLGSIIDANIIISGPFCFEDGRYYVPGGTDGRAACQP